MAAVCNRNDRAVKVLANNEETEVEGVNCPNDLVAVDLGRHMDLGFSV